MIAMGLNVDEGGGGGGTGGCIPQNRKLEMGTQYQMPPTIFSLKAFLLFGLVLFLLVARQSVPFSSPTCFWRSVPITVEPCYNEVLWTLKITLLYQVSHYIRAKKQRNIKSWDQQNYLVIRGFCYIRPLYNEVPLYYVTNLNCLAYKKTGCIHIISNEDKMSVCHPLQKVY